MKGIDIKLLRAFMILAEKGSYHNAAQALFLTQPALSKQIKILEKLTGGKLFLRGRHGATLTDFGNQLFRKADELLQSHSEFIKYIQELHARNQERLNIGFGISSFHSVPLWINQFRRKYSDCEVIINELPSSVQMQMLSSGHLHVGFVRMPVAEYLTSIIIHEEILALAIPSNCRVECVSIQKVLSTYPLLQLNSSASPCLVEQTALFLESNQLCAHPLSVTDNISTLLALVAGGNGIAFLPASVKHFLPEGVKLIVPSVKQIRWSIGVAWNPNIINQQRDEFLKIVTAINSVEEKYI